MALSCSSTDGTDDDVNDDKYLYVVNYTQSGDMENSTVLLSIIGMGEGSVVESNILSEDGTLIGSTAMLNMHDKEEGTFSYMTEDKVSAVYLVLTAAVDDDAEKDYEYSITVTKDGEEVFDHNETFVIGCSMEQRSFTID